MCKLLYKLFQSFLFNYKQYEYSKISITRLIKNEQ